MTVPAGRMIVHARDADPLTNVGERVASLMVRVEDADGRIIVSRSDTAQECLGLCSVIVATRMSRRATRSVRCPLHAGG